MGTCSSCRKEKGAKKEINIYIYFEGPEKKSPPTPSSDWAPFSPDPIRDCQYKDPRHYDSRGCPRGDY